MSTNQLKLTIYNFQTFREYYEYFKTLNMFYMYIYTSN